jgi:hypothetical protein
LKGRKFILFLILSFSGIWFFQYFFSFTKGASTFLVFLVGISLWFALIGIAILQLIILIFEKPKIYQRLIFVSAILFLNLFSLTKPKGLVNWEKYEGENLLVAERIGTAKCRTKIKLKDGNKFKFENHCFGIDFQFGTYILKGDTLFFALDEVNNFMDKSSFAILLRGEKDTSKYYQLLLFENHEKTRSLNFEISEIKMNKISNQK